MRRLCCGAKGQLRRRNKVSGCGRAISGIRPQVALTISSLGIEFGDIATKAALADALAFALHQAGLKIAPA
jgi:rsbT co-antagonist protein RsbR